MKNKKTPDAHGIPAEVYKLVFYHQLDPLLGMLGKLLEKLVSIRLAEAIRAAGTCPQGSSTLEQGGPRSMLLWSSWTRFIELRHTAAGLDG